MERMLVLLEGTLVVGIYLRTICARRVICRGDELGV